MAELKPCPFCGSNPYVVVSKYRHDQKTFAIKCSNMECKIIPMTYEHAEERFACHDWNERFDNG